MDVGLKGERTACVVNRGGCRVYKSIHGILFAIQSAVPSAWVLKDSSVCETGRMRTVVLYIEPYVQVRWLNVCVHKRERCAHDAWVCSEHATPHPPSPNGTKTFLKPKLQINKKKLATVSRQVEAGGRGRGWGRSFQSWLLRSTWWSLFSAFSTNTLRLAVCPGTHSVDWEELLLGRFSFYLNTGSSPWEPVRV